ncbi:MAG: glycosyltransferase family 2 protein [Planctomycetes bacterium]|nr:glycosyltransferase family 2 protein [Planctomycetota bacterium]
MMSLHESAAVGIRATIVLPTYNEAGNLPALVARIAEVIPQAEILVVDDASPDGTASVARGLARRYPVRTVERSRERGLATAVLRGLAEASSGVCVVMDADLSHPPEAIPALIEAVRAGADIAVGSRYAVGGEIDAWPRWRRWVSLAGTLLARPITGVRDPMAGFFCVRRSLLRYEELKPRGFKILLEILARTRGARVVEVPIRFADRRTGDSKFGSRERREFLKQVWALYRDLNAWPWRLAKFLITGGIGYAVHMAILCALVEGARWGRTGSVVCAFALSMTANYALNRSWTFRARRAGVARSYAIYVLGAAGGLLTQLAVMHALSGIHYVLAASLGIAAGTLFTVLTSQQWAFAKR